MDKNGISKDGPPLRCMGAVEILRGTPKFGSNSVDLLTSQSTRTPSSVVEKQEGCPEILGPDSPNSGKQSSSKDELSTPLAAKPRPVGIKKSKRMASSSRSHGNDGSVLIAAAMKEKTSVKKNELRFKCINALPDGDAKTKLLLDFLSSDSCSQPTQLQDE